MRFFRGSTCVGLNSGNDAPLRDHRVCPALSRINHEGEILAAVCADRPGACLSVSFLLPGAGCMPRLKISPRIGTGGRGGDSFVRQWAGIGCSDWFQYMKPAFLTGFVSMRPNLFLISG